MEEIKAMVQDTVNDLPEGIVPWDYDLWCLGGKNLEHIYFRGDDWPEVTKDGRKEFRCIKVFARANYKIKPDPLGIRLTPGLTLRTLSFYLITNKDSVNNVLLT